MQEKRWVIKFGSSYIALDSDSGGYHYYSHFWDCQKFRSFEEACSYIEPLKNKEYKIFEVTDILLEEVEPMDMFEIELAILKKKHGRN